MRAERILIRCDAAPGIGSGHVMRCLTLARALAGKGAAVGFAASAETVETVPALARAGFAHISLDRPLDADELLARGERWDALVIDHYGIDVRQETALREIAPVIVVIDDLADRRHDCDILLDQTVGREAGDYAGLVPPAAELLLGPEYALVRPEFTAARPAALARREAGKPVSRLLVSLGMTDIGGITAWAARAALEAGLEAEVAVAVGARAPSMPHLRALAERDPRLVFYPDCDDMAGLMASSDLAIGAGGTTSWERCCLGLPTIVLVLAENQALIARNLARLGAVRALRGRDAAELTAAVRDLAADREARVEMAISAGRLTNGRGADIVAQGIAHRVPKARRACR